MVIEKPLQAKAFYNGEGQFVMAMTPVFDQEGLITPCDAAYVVQHFAIPDAIQGQDWRLRVDGRVRNAVTLSLDDLRQLPGRTVRVVQECSSNDAQMFDAEYRERFVRLVQHLDPGYQGKRHEGGLISAAEYTGVALSDVLELAGLATDAVAVRAEGRDYGSPDPVLHDLPETAAPLPPFNYEKGLPLAKALHPDTLLAWAHNGEVLDHRHGAPLRLVVPGWAGNWSVKWLQQLEVLDAPATCWYQTEHYYYSKSPNDTEREMITCLPVKSILTYPRDDHTMLTRGCHRLRGLAWSGAGHVTGVDVSVDDGESWHAAHLEEPCERWMWVRWSLPWDFTKPGVYSILCRASDDAGRVQPRDAWNYTRKNFHGIVPTPVTIT